ncbi:MAG: c-type cytochrome domain-containing protein [Phycisphaerae bacterium]|nr:c-type cytochrome domain-containing protein [Phycisphaerae bacterium]
MSLLQEMLAVPNDPRMLHAATVHLPVALSVIGVGLVAALVWVGGRNATLRTISLVAYVALLVSAFASTRSGEAAEGKLGRLPKPLRALVHDHEEMGEKIWIFAAVAALGIGAGWHANRQLAGAGRAVAAVAALGCAGWVAVTAHYGGTLVYEHGLGAPKRSALAEGAGDGPTSASAPSARDLADPRLSHFRTQVWPVLVESCIGCHEGDEPASGLNLTTIANILRGGENGAAVVAGNAERSLLYKMVAHAEGVTPMPFRGDRLSDGQIAAIRKWIEDGAVWDAPATSDR